VTSFPYVGESYIDYYSCMQQLITLKVTDGASRLIGASIEDIQRTVNRTSSSTPSFDCVKDELLSYHEYLQNISEFIVPQLRSIVLKTSSKYEHKIKGIIRGIF
jgi:hypothetical protein